MQPDTPIIATLTSADGSKETYLTADEIELIMRGLTMVWQQTQRLHTKYEAPRHCRPIVALEDKILFMMRK